MSNRNSMARMLGQPPQTAGADGGLATQQENLFSFAVPTTFVELPSGGVFYPDGHPLHNQETVEIKFMTAKEEDILTSTSLIKNNMVFDRLISSILIDKSIDPKTLLVGDRNAIILEARKTAYGPDYETTFNCPACSERIEYRFNLDFFQNKELIFGELEGVTLSSDGLFQIQLPVSKITIDVKLLTVREETILNKELDKKIKGKGSRGGERNATDNLKSFIKRVNGTDDIGVVHSFVENMPAADARYARKVYRELVPDVDMTHEFACEKCGEIADLEVPLNVEFFWPK